MPTFVQYTGDGSNATFTVPFPFIERAHVKVRLGGFLCTEGAHYDFNTATSIRFRPQFLPALNQPITLRRETPATALVTYQDGALLTQEDLNTATLQALYRVEEIEDRYEASLEAGLTRLNNGQVATVEEALDALAQEVLASDLAQDLLQRIGDIDVNAEDIVAANAQIADLQSQINALSTISGENIATLILNEQTQRIAGDQALAQDIALIGAKNGANTAFILNMSTVRVDATTSLGTRLSGIDVATAANAASIAAESTARANGDSALASSLSTLTSTVNNNNSTLTARIATEETTRATADSALSTSIANLTATVNSNNSAINARVDTESTARANGDNALATSIATVNASVVANDTAINARVATEETARANGDSALSSSITALAATVTTNNNTLTARISTEETARANGDSSLASSITSLTSTVNGNSAQIATIQTVQNGIAAQYMVKLDVNGHVSGFGLYNNGGSSQFLINATRFAVIQPGAGLNAPVVPFVVSGGVVFMQNVVIGNALISDLTVNKLTTGVLNAGISFGAGQLSLSAGGRTMYFGATGVGASSEYLQWFGPTPVTGAAGATDGAAQFYIKNNGDAYFAGTLAANIVVANNIANGALSDSNSNTAAGTFTNSGWTTRGTVTFTPSAAASRLLLLISGVVTIGDAAPVATNAQVRITRNGTVIFGPAVVSNLRANPIPYSFQFTNSGLTGAQVYNIEYLASAAAGLGDPHSVTNSSITVLELKK